MNFREQERRRAELSIAPLIDIVFLLLVFFMLAGSFLNLEALEPGYRNRVGRRWRIRRARDPLARRRSGDVRERCGGPG